MSVVDTAKELITVEDFLAMSAVINYQLSSRTVNNRMLLGLLLQPTDYDGPREPLLNTIAYLQRGYGRKTRVLGPPAILHPLRTAALLARVMNRPTLIDLLASLLHDHGEDLDPDDFDADSHTTLKDSFRALVEKIDADNAWYLGERIDLLTRRSGQSYHDYICRILDNAHRMKDLLHVKCADRLDNSLDLYVQHPGITKINFFRIVYDILFIPDHYKLDLGPYVLMPENPFWLSQLFKNCVFLSLMRSRSLDTLDEATARLFAGLAVASIRASQGMVLEIFSTSLTDTKTQRELLLETMEYCANGGIAAITGKGRGGELDGIFLEHYALTDEVVRKARLAELCRDKKRVTRLLIAFISIFSAFLGTPDFTIKGVNRAGLEPAG